VVEKCCIKEGTVHRKDLSLLLRKDVGRVLRAVALIAAVFTMAVPAFAARAVKQRVAPQYPELAKRMKIAGAVKLEVKVDAEGKVLAVKTIEGNHMLAQAAEDAMKRWKFEAGPSETTEEVTLNFATAP